MTYSDFTNKIGTLAAYIEKENRLYENGVDLTDVTSSLIDDYVDLLASHYPESKETIAYFLWELDFGSKWRPGFMIDEYGRDVRLDTVRALWDECERYVDFTTSCEDDFTKEVGRHRGIEYYICWNGFCWVSYIDVSYTRFAGGLMDASLGHGGVTYADNHLPFESGDSFDKGRWFIGWDYAHGDDLLRDWTTTQIRRDVFDTIRQLENLQFDEKCDII